MQFSVLFVIAAVSMSALALPQPATNRVARAAVNLNQGSDRQITDVGNGEFNVDDLIFTDSNLAAQVACALDERDCTLGKAACDKQRVDCQSGNGINGQTALLNKD